MKNLLILVFYIKIDGQKSKVKIQQYLNDIIEGNKISHDVMDATNTEILQYYIPIEDNDSYIECIYPKNYDEFSYIKDIIENANNELINFLEKNKNKNEHI